MAGSLRSVAFDDLVMDNLSVHSVATSGLLSPETVRETLEKGLAGQFRGQKVLVLIPDHTRSMPLQFLFRTFFEILHDAKRLDFMVALGTHPTLGEENLNKLVGITAEERATSAVLLDASLKLK